MVSAGRGMGGRRRGRCLHQGGWSVVSEGGGEGKRAQLSATTSPHITGAHRSSPLQLLGVTPCTAEQEKKAKSVHPKTTFSLKDVTLRLVQMSRSWAEALRERLLSHQYITAEGRGSAATSVLVARKQGMNN
ncbi:hypothetical protein INR49_024647 [Caranx melampygus]|nr:hypothetical protein INR49_024647 [Caranx melampygus]